jgi:hypothetical protein
MAASGCLDLHGATKGGEIAKGYVFDERNSRSVPADHPEDDAQSILNGYHSETAYKELKILYPYNNSIFPPEIASPTFKWERETGIETWLLSADFEGKHEPLYILCDKADWTPSKKLWELIKENSKEQPAEITVLSIDRDSESKVLSRGTVALSTSKDEVGAPIMFRRVPPSFEYASAYPELMEWCLSDVSSYDPPPVIMSNMPVCASCHTFSGDGRVLGMDVDYKGDKGAYALTNVHENVELTDRDFISWNDHPRNDGLIGTGLFPRISPDGSIVVSTINDILFLAKISDPHCSQLFFPIQGNLGVYTKEDGKISPLATGSEGSNIVETDPSWSPDGEYILFSGTTWTHDLYAELGGKTVFKAEGVGVDQLNEQYPVQFDIYRVPFNKGKGGTAQPLAGAGGNGKSNYYARYSPDGKWIVFTQSATGIAVQPDSKLYIIPSTGGEAKLMSCNLGLLNSWHTWSPNSRWLAFVSKENSAYTELFLTHIDEKGNDSPPILVERFSKSNYAINVPEFANISPEDIREIKLAAEKTEKIDGGGISR